LATITTRRGSFPRISEKHSNEQLPNELSAVFSELQGTKHLRQAGIRKSFGFPCAIYFSLCLVFSFIKKIGLPLSHPK
ncbi:hypothetical protein K4G98_28345, partial [Mycobacterium tuberculosis]|nr:hypothetical protein [Mycobacterium tuberculosis]